jgi:hypothetical protein
MQKTKIHWTSLLVLTILVLGAAFVLLITLGMGVNSLISLFNDESDPAGQMISAFAYGFEAVILLICSWFVLQKTLGREQAELPFKFSFASWQVIVAVGIVLSSVLVGGVIAYKQITWLAWIMLPVLTVLVILPPILLLFGIGANGIEFGPRWRILGMLGLSMTLGPLIMIVMEIIVLLGIILIGSVVITLQQPGLTQEILNLARILKQGPNEEMILKLLGPYISNPFVIATLISYIAILVPLIEELFKPLAVWIFIKKIESPAQGFVMGLISGAAFALIESLNASGNGTTSWPIIVSIRAGTGLLHIATSGLVGWGIIAAFREKRIMRFFAAYFTAATIHGIWNACAVGAGLSLVGEFIGKPEWLFNIIPAMLCGMSVLGIGMFAVLIASNRKLRNSPLSPALPLLEAAQGGDEGAK